MEVNEISSVDRRRGRRAGRGDAGNRPQRAAGGVRHRQVSQNISGVTDATAETGQAAGLVLQSSGRLTEKLQSLENEVSTFVAGVRAA